MTAERVLDYSAERDVKSRRIKFDFKANPEDRYYVDGDVAMSHLVAILSAGFPPGEEAFIRSVHHYMDEIVDPVLKEQVKGFIGQEMTHGREHRSLNEALAEMGYPVRFIESLGAGLKVIEKLVPPAIPVASTAAAEHLTATLAERVLANKDYIDRVANDEEIKGVLNWHAFEELEHKAVAFDVMRDVAKVSEPVRIVSGAVMIALGIPLSAVGLFLSMSTDPYARRRPIHSTLRAIAILRNPIFRGLVPELAQYLRPGFHPDDVKTDELLEECRERFFGENGELVHNLK